MTIYFIKAGRSVKIGYTTGDPERRLRELQTANPRKLVLLAAIPGSREDEVRLHKKFDSDRVTGEWFTLSRSIKKLLRQLEGWTFSVPDQNELFLEKFWQAYPDVGRAVGANAATCEEIAEHFRWRAVNKPDRYAEFADWQEDDVARALHAFGIPTRRMKFWETVSGAWGGFEDGPFVWQEGVEYDEVLEYFLVDRGTYWDGTAMSAREVASYRKALHRECGCISANSVLR